MSEVEVGDDGKIRRTRRCKQFHENIVAYNNSVSFASEGVDNIDRNVAPFTFRMQGNIYHQLPPLVPVDGERPPSPGSSSSGGLMYLTTSHEPLHC